MEMLQVLGLALAAGVVLVVLRQQRPEMALLLSVATGVVLFTLVVGRLLAVIQTLEALGSRARIDVAYLGTVLKIIGIAYLADFGSQVLTDAGERAIAAKVEMAGKVLILLLAVPILVAILERLLDMVG
ncbi:stage III sporulation protein AD [Caldinitratiruptor microaerophilus]|uniref:Stage III sporulation protein AD n=1 Tax=Caldinitratiruptor microaerophilus TaxID=671077 RepID=A0AA35CJY9_9FIRM|nr:stage III sporulation protein AD [Caldinitratiruptor microaerophilus]BDG59874.1 stage III sporulation protein AD [Caldinitratiruptor microaerophilus]